jgi:hypothetical protein
VPKTEADIEQLASGIADFVLHALTGLRRSAQQRAEKSPSLS